MDLELRRYNRKHLILFCGLMVFASLLAVATLVFPNKPLEPKDIWCPNEMVTITRILAKENYAGPTLLIDEGRVDKTFKRLPFVELYNAEENKTYQGYVFNHHGGFAVVNLQQKIRNKDPICVTHARLGVFLLYEPVKIL